MAKWWKLSLNQLYSPEAGLTNQIYQYFSGANGAIVMPADFRADAADPAGSDFGLFAADKQTPIPRRLIKYDTVAGTLAFDALVPSYLGNGQGNTDLYAKIGDEDISLPAVGEKNTNVYPPSLFGTKGACWPLDDVSLLGATTRDESANAFDLTINGATMSPGLGGRQMQTFNGTTGQRLQRSSTPCGNYQSQNAFSIFAITNRELSGVFQTCLSVYASFAQVWEFKEADNVQCLFMQLYSFSTNYINLQSPGNTVLRNNYNTVGLTSKNTPPWQAALYKSGAVVTGYINSGTSALTYSIRAVRIGCGFDALGALINPFKGKIGQVYLYECSRSTEEHLAQRNNFNAADFWIPGPVESAGSARRRRDLQRNY